MVLLRSNYVVLLIYGSWRTHHTSFTITVLKLTTCVLLERLMFRNTEEVLLNHCYHELSV
jgi:hypothetical protein